MCQAASFAHYFKCLVRSKGLGEEHEVRSKFNGYGDFDALLFEMYFRHGQGMCEQLSLADLQLIRVIVLKFRKGLIFVTT